MPEPAQCRFAIHTQFLKQNALSHFLKLTLRAQLFFAGKKNKKQNTAHFSKNRERAQGFSGSMMDRSEHDGNERARCAELVR